MSRWLTIKTLPMDYEKTDKAGTWIGWGKWRRESQWFKCTDVMWLATLARKIFGTTMLLGSFKRPLVCICCYEILIL